MHATVVGPDGRHRCWWGAEPEIYRAYHDTEWGFAVTDDRRLFEKLCLEGFQAGLSWLTILRKREAFREAFCGFDFERIAGFDESDVERLLADPGIVRHGGKIRSVINNAARALELREEHGSLADFFWEFADRDSTAPQRVPATSPGSVALAKELKRRGWTFVGPTTVYSFMQAMGLVNDHLATCWVRQEAENSRQRAFASR
ncbi:MAG: DNA-3-methyladenine glycosylase I [Actinomycetes bacterium]|jgi:DNA-3-methyladenine glycosylase I|nr:DNA-3-methyladenine glycosylase I [Acidimicrobiia bacterium]